MSVAERVIAKFEGAANLAREIGKPMRTVQSWKDRGTVPAKHQQEVLDAARRLRIALEPADFFEAA